MTEEEKQLNQAIEKLGQKPAKKKFPTSVFILLMLVGFLCVAGYAIYLEKQYNETVVELHDCKKDLLAVPQQEEKEAWYKNVSVQEVENDIR